MRIYPVIVKRFIQGAPGAGFIASVIRSGIELINRFTLLGGTILPGISASATNSRLRTAQQDTGFLASLRPVTGSVAPLAQNPALNHKTVIAQFQTPENPALELVRLTYNLTHRSGANAVTEANGACGRQDFDTPANAQGLANGTLSTCASAALAARCGRLNLAYANFANKSELTITQVNLHFYYSQNSLLSCVSTGGFNFGGADTQLFSNAVNTVVNALTTPQTYNITASVAGSWTDLDNLRTYVIAEIGALSPTEKVEVDAVELEVIASKIDNL